MDCYSNDTDTHDIEQLISEVEAHLDKTFLVIQKRNMEDSKKENSTIHIEKTTLKSDGKLDAKLSVKEYAHEKVSASNLKIDEIDNEMGDYLPIAQENILECTEYEIYRIQEHVADNQLKEHFELEELNKEYSKINIEIHNMQQTKSNMMNNVVCMKDKNMLNAKNKNKSCLVDAIVIENREDPSNLESSVDFILMKKKKKKKVKFAPEIVTSAMHDTAIINCPQVNKLNFDQYFDDTTADYTYNYLLTRAFKMIREKNPNLNEEGKKKLIMKPPQVLRIGAKKTSFANFLEICRILHRLPHHLQSFLLTELGTSGSVDGNNQLIIKGRFQQKQIESVLRKYIKEYVTCHTCYSPSTLLQRNTRLCFLQCEACGSRCSVASIKSGFQAVINKRAAMRAKAL